VTPHLSSQDIALSILGEEGPGVAQHLAECAKCRTELTSLKQALASFRESAHAWADTESGSNRRILDRIERGRFRYEFGRTSVAAVAALACVLATVYIQDRPKQIQLAPAQIDDEALLESVQQEVSDTLPSSFTSLRDFIAPDNDEMEVH
jgi:hypothetical protein